MHDPRLCSASAIGFKSEFSISLNPIECLSHNQVQFSSYYHIFASCNIVFNPCLGVGQSERGTEYHILWLHWLRLRLCHPRPSYWATHQPSSLVMVLKNNGLPSSLVCSDILRERGSLNFYISSCLPLVVPLYDLFASLIVLWSEFLVSY